MFRYLAENIAFVLIKNKILDIEDRDIYVYGLEAILLNAILLISTFLVSLLFGGMIHYVGFCVFFIPLRVFVGGYHAKKSESCFILSVGMYVISLMVANSLPDIYQNEVVMAMTIMSFLILLIWAPVINPKHPMADYQIKRNKKIEYVIIGLDFAFLVIFSKMNLVIASSIEIFILLVTVIFLIGKIEGRIIVKDE